MGRTADAGVLLMPKYVTFPTLGRTENDVQAVLEQYFDFSIPLFVWEYPTERGAGVALSDRDCDYSHSSDWLYSRRYSESMASDGSDSDSPARSRIVRFSRSLSVSKSGLTRM